MGHFESARPRTKSHALLASRPLCRPRTAGARPSCWRSRPALLAGSQLTSSSRAGAGSSIGSLRAADVALVSKSRSAALELFGLESALTGARADVESARARLDEVRREAADTERQLGRARSTLAVAQRQLADRLRALYVEGETDPLEVILGARSLDEAIARVDGLEAIAAHDRAIVRSTKAARTRLTSLRRRLALRERSLARVEAEAAARAADLERTAAERRSYLASLAEQRRLGAARIAELERAATARARASAAPAPRQAHSAAVAPPSPTPAETRSRAVVPTPAVTGGPRTLTVSSTGYALTGTTATGLPVGPGVVAVDPSVIPLGTRMTSRATGKASPPTPAARCAAAIIDLWFPTRRQARAWGRRRSRSRSTRLPPLRRPPCAAPSRGRQLSQATRTGRNDAPRVVLVDDHDLFRTGLRTLLEEQGIEWSARPRTAHGRFAQSASSRRTSSSWI